MHTIFTRVLFYTLLLFHVPVSLLFAQTEYTTYTNNKFDFAVDLPSHWLSENINDALVFSGPRSSEEWQTTINFQMIPNDENISLDSIASELKKQWGNSPEYELISETSGKLDDKPAIRMLVSYGVNNGNDIIQQEQFVVQGKSYFYTIAYTAPSSLFNKHAAKMAKAIDSFHLISPGAELHEDRRQLLAQTEDKLLLFIKAVQEFRLQNAADGSEGWRNFADADVQQYVKNLDRKIWPEGEADAGWAYFFSLAVSDVGLMTSNVPVVGYYHPWSDVWIVTQWQTEPEPRIIAAEILLGEWVRTQGAGPLDISPAWLRQKGFRPEQLALAVSQSLQSFDKAVNADQSWQKVFRLPEKAMIMEQINYPAAASALLFSWLRVMDIYAENKAEPILGQLTTAGEAFIKAGSTKQMDRHVAFTSGTTPYTLKILQSLPAEFFPTLVPVYWTGNNQSATLYLIPAGNPDICITLRFLRGTERLQIDRVDVLNFPEIMKTYLQAGKEQ